MKKILLTLSLLLAATSIFAQQSKKQNNEIQKQADSIGQGGNNEIKLNLLNTVIGLAEINYERLINDNQGLGLAVAISVIDENSYGENFNYIISPYYRVYFGKHKANGFFVEANTSILSVNEVRYSYNPQNYSSTRLDDVSKTNVGIGVAAGFKFLTRNGILGEVFLGGGRVLGKNTYNDGFPRIGISLGKRF